MLYSKNGSIPQSQTDGTDGWIEVPDAPIAPEGKEVVWWYPPGWVVRDPDPSVNYAWNQTTETWVKIMPQIATPTIEPLTSEPISAITSDQISGLSTAQIGV